jgi:uncharacterized protein YqjF (DUF2071 family)
VSNDHTSVEPGRQSRPFLTARWVNLLLITFRAPEKLVRKVLHRNLEPDYWEGNTHVSLVAFDFLDTRVKGWRIPLLGEFPEINLRTYARHGNDRGVVFIREFVPHRLVSLVARLRYNEPYQALRMASRTRPDKDAVTVTHRFSMYRMRASGSTTTILPARESMEHHFKEHAWGFGTNRNGRLLRYRVEHPLWPVRRIQEFDYDIDFRALYGQRWGFLNERTPVSVIYAVGSAVEVYPPRTT